MCVFILHMIREALPRKEVAVLRSHPLKLKLSLNPKNLSCCVKKQSGGGGGSPALLS